MKLKLVKIKEFKQTVFRYINSKPKCKLENYRDTKRISYRLPNNLRERHYISDSVILADSNKLQKYLAEFETLLLNGYFPVKVIDKLGLDSYTKGDGKITIEEAFERYYSDYSTGKRSKSIRTVYGDGRTLKYIVRKYFIKRLGLKYITDFNTDVLVKFNKDVESFKKGNTDETIRLATVASYKKMVKAFINCLIDHDKIDRASCDTTKIVKAIYRKGKAMPQACARLIHIPFELVEAIKTCSYKTRDSKPDAKQLFLFAAETGLRRAELLTLSTHNLFPSVENFNSIVVCDKPDCPTYWGDGFTVKSERSNRILPLSRDAQQFIKDQLEKHKHDKIFGTVGSKASKDVRYIEYPFLFPYYESRAKKWTRMDTFGKSFATVLETAAKEAKLSFDGSGYKFHDFRRTVNLWLRDKVGLTGEEAASMLGHRLETNERNYLDVKEHQKILHKKISEKMTNYYSNNS